MAAVAAMQDSGLWLPGASSTKEDKIEKWWEVNRKHDPPLTRGATPLVERCMRVKGWNEAFTKRVLKGYRQFMELKSVMNDWQATKLCAPTAVEQMWEQHILDNINYHDDCILLFGRVVGHNPDANVNERNTVERIKTTKIAFQARYGADLDPDVWNYGPSSDNGNNMAVDSEAFGVTGGVPTTPRGRLPVSKHVIGGSDDDDAPMATERGHSLTKSPKSPKSPSGNEPITIFLCDTSSGEETYFSLRYRSTLRIVFTVFAERKNLNQENIKFSYEGQSLTGYETPYSLGLEDRARIDVQVQRR